jgi:hypothetical protein
MSESQDPGQGMAGASRDELMSARFAAVVLQQTNMAMMLLGKIAHPETGETMSDLGSARMFIDQLEMLEFKTKGNLNEEETRLITQSLTSLRLAFVEAVDQADKSKGTETSAPETPASPPAAPAPDAEGESSETVVADEEGSRKKKFSKSYGEG